MKQSLSTRFQKQSTTHITIAMLVLSLTLFNSCDNKDDLLPDFAITSWNMGKPTDGSTTPTDAVIATVNGDVLTISGSGATIDKSSMGAHWSKIKSIVVEKGVTEIGAYTFQIYDSLITVTLPEGLTAIGKQAFGCCPNLTTVTLPESLTTIGDFAFNECINLSSIVLPKSLESIGYCAFQRCISLTSVTLHAAITEIGNSAFINCYNLREVYNLSPLTIEKGSIDNGWVAHYTMVVHTDANAPHVEFVDEGNYKFAYYNGKGYVSNYKGKDKEISIPISFTCYNKRIAVEEILSYAFWNCYRLTSIALPTIKSIGENAFYTQSDLTSVTLGTALSADTDIEFGESVFYNNSTQNVDLTLGKNVKIEGVADTDIANKKYKGYTFKQLFQHK